MSITHINKFNKIIKIRPFKTRIIPITHPLEPQKLMHDSHSKHLRRRRRIRNQFTLQRPNRPRTTTNGQQTRPKKPPTHRRNPKHGSLNHPSQIKPRTQLHVKIPSKYSKLT